jgi:hypothetical protein
MIFLRFRRHYAGCTLSSVITFIFDDISSPHFRRLRHFHADYFTPTSFRHYAFISSITPPSLITPFRFSQIAIIATPLCRCCLRALS